MDAMPPDGHAASDDALTGLVGREAARERLREWLAAGAQVQGVLLGLRRFDAVNLAFGHAAGDVALVEVAARIAHFAADELEGEWLAARSAGGQFLLLATEPCSRERWQALSGELVDTCSRPIPTSAGTVRLSLRAALLRGLGGESADSILDRLGQTLAVLMAQSGRRLGWADGEATRVGRSAAQLESDLLGALDRDEIEVVYQPQFSCLDDRLTGAEALARWNHPGLGRLGAGTLFAVAERTDHVAALSRHVARLALEGARRWPMDLRLSLNITPSDLAAADFAAQFLALAERTGMAPWRLTLEVTEQVLLADVAQAAHALGDLAAKGMRIALDDFGAGFCNFRYLKLLPLHYLKLDRSMVDRIATSPRDLAVLRAIIAMAGALELKVIAEGIESEAQRALVAAEGCTFYQGFVRAGPMGLEEFLKLARG